jgi:hypothetical protein
MELLALLLDAPKCRNHRTPASCTEGTSVLPTGTKSSEEPAPAGHAAQLDIFADVPNVDQRTVRTHIAAQPWELKTASRAG